MIFNKFTDSDVVLGRSNKVSSGFWSDGNYAHSQSLLYTSSNQVKITGSNSYEALSGLYYFNVYNSDPNTGTNVDSQVHFSIAYGNYYGSGSGSPDTASLIKPTKAIYSQYRNYLLQPTDTFFSFRSGSLTKTVDTITDSTFTAPGSSIYIIAFSADKFKDKVDEGQLEFTLSGSTGRLTLVDDSPALNTQQDVYSIVSGSIVDGVSSVSSGSVRYDGYGLFYPKTGIVILNAEKIYEATGISADLSSTGAYKVNQKKIYDGLRLAGRYMFKVRKSEYFPSRQYFVRVKNKDFNYSNNPTYIADGLNDKDNDGVLLPRGTIKNSSFLTDPKTYPTTIGLYDDSNELVAIAKFSAPREKSFDTELLCRVRIDF